MSDGELRKRVAKQFVDFEKESFVGFHRLGAEAYVAKVLDEAKKEFPKFDFQTLDIQQTQEQQAIDELYLWKKKWFGE